MQMYVAHVAEPDDLDVARRRFPVGTHVTGHVSYIPEPGRIGVFVDLGSPPTGFVDVVYLPVEDGSWPAVGTVASFEVLQHRRGQVRLFPLGDGIPLRQPSFLPPEHEWLSRQARYPIDSFVTGTVTDLFTSNREYIVRFDECASVLEWTGTAPTVGDTRLYRVAKYLDYTRRILLAAANKPVD
jgi:hypothetical protein